LEFGVWGFGCGLLEWEFVAWVYMESGWMVLGDWLGIGIVGADA